MKSVKAIEGVKNNKIVKGNPDTSIDGLISQAIQNKVSVEIMQQLMAMRRELKSEWSKEQYFKALSEFQAECPIIIKSQEVLNKDKTTVRYNFAPLDKIILQVKDLLKKHGFSYDIKAKQTPKSFIAVVEAHHIDGHSESTEMTMDIADDDYMNDNQHIGSASTYAKRYAFCNIFGILTGDQDNDTNSKYAKKAITLNPIDNANFNKIKILAKDKGLSAEDVKFIMRNEIGNSKINLTEEETKKIVTAIETYVSPVKSEVK